MSQLQFSVLRGRHMANTTAGLSSMHLDVLLELSNFSVLLLNYESRIFEVIEELSRVTVR